MAKICVCLNGWSDAFHDAAPRSKGRWAKTDAEEGRRAAFESKAPVALKKIQLPCLAHQDGDVSTEAEPR